MHHATSGSAFHRNPVTCRTGFARPCRRHGPARCPRVHEARMLKLPPEEDPVPGPRAAASTLLAAAVLADPFVFFQPTVRLTQSDRSALEAGNAVARTVQAPSGNVAIVAAVPV